MPINLDDIVTTIPRSELSDEQAQDLAIASEARKEAMEKQTGYSVGAAIRTKDGKVVVGWNMENILQKGIHAEENAACNIPKASREAGMKRITVTGGKTGKESSYPVASCGFCAEFLMQYLNREDNPEVIMAGVVGDVKRALLRDFLPIRFDPPELREDAEED